MRKFLYIFAAILAYLLLCSRSCDSDEQSALSLETELMQTKETIRNEFGSEDLSRKSLRAFEVKAEQKLVDLADYLNIYYDGSMDESFKAQARSMILDLFISDSVMMNILLSQETDEKNLPITEFLKIDSAPAYLSKDILLDSVEIARPLRRIDEFNYLGYLAFSRRLKICSHTDTLITGPVRMEVEILASKVNKTFGKDTLQVWGVFFGEIR